MPTRIFVSILLVIACSPPVHAGWEPRGWVVPQPEAEIGPTNPTALPFQWALSFYQNTISRVDGDRCPSYPSCSAYAKEAFRKHGPITGYMLTAARLLGEADEAAFSPRVFVEGKWKVYSPVEDDMAFIRGPLDP